MTEEQIEMLRFLIKEEVEAAAIDGMEHGVWGWAEKQLDENWKKFQQLFTDPNQYEYESSTYSDHMTNLTKAFCESVKETFLEEDRDSNFPSENCMPTDYRSLCIRLLIAIDSANAKAEDHVLCQIRQAVKYEENRAMALACKNQ